jgi:hypothetical protein
MCCAVLYILLLYIEATVAVAVVVVVLEQRRASWRSHCRSSVFVGERSNEWLKKRERERERDQINSTQKARQNKIR